MTSCGRAIVRPPSANFGAGLTTADLGPPDYPRALEQHARYCEALEACGVTLFRLPPDPAHPDATFVEDAAVLLPGEAIVTRPGAPSRLGEIEAVEAALSSFFARRSRIEAPGTLDGGDVCEAGDRFLIGISARTNEEGAHQLADRLAAHGIASSRIDVRGIAGILHLKSGVAWLGEGRVAAIEALAGHPEIRRFEVLAVAAEEAYAANCVRVNDRLLVAEGFPRFASAVRRLGYHPIPVAMSEFERMDGGLSCLSLRF